MGIPYYFASLLRTHKHAVQSVRMKMDVDILAIDFNCLIHFYLKDDAPIESVLAGLDMILKDVCSPQKHLYIAMDGLVPYAKIVQQRYRRMKIQEAGEFDRNQISPDTPYMKELAQAVRAKYPTAIVSDTTEAGEGEHKIFRWLKALDPSQRKNVCIYGLDADLILLSMANVHLTDSMKLLRESSELQGTVTPFSTLNVDVLRKALPIEYESYIRLCCLCFGNDFLPPLSMFSLREDGYNRAIQLYQSVQCPDLRTPEGRRVFLEAALQKEASVLQERVKLRNQPFESNIVVADGSYLKERYAIHFLDGISMIPQACESFWTTYDWVLEYFFVNECPNWEWYYTFAEPPLVSMLLEHPLKGSLTPKPCSFGTAQQLKVILPAASLRRTRKRVVYPDEKYHEETGTRPPWMKKFRWECDPLVSIPWHPTWKLTTTESVLF
jgi:5'-3' exonuclease